VSLDLPSCVILHATPRTAKIARVDPARPEREHVLACNIDQLIILASYLAPPVKWGLIDRYLVMAEEQRLPAVIVLNKRDLLEESGKDAFFEECQQRIEIYKSLGYPVYNISALKDSVRSKEIKALHDVFKDKISILSGHSGVGKSSIVNLFKPEIVQDVESNPDIFYKGRHTTTYASMIKLGTGGYIVDTPGIRSFLLGNHNAISLTDSFVDFRPYLGACKFRECRHVDEPGCAILEAVKSGKITMARYHSYINILTGETGREGRIRDL
jgi:ribosome biogenesis GTPase